MTDKTKDSLLVDSYLFRFRRRPFFFRRRRRVGLGPGPGRLGPVFRVFPKLAQKKKSRKRNLLL